MLTTYLNALKNKGNFTIESIANLSNVPEATVRNIMSGKTGDPRFETVSSIVIAMGGSLDAVYSITQSENKDAEATAFITIKESYEQRITELKEYYEHRLVEKDKHHERVLLEAEKHIDTIKLDKRWFRLASVFSIIALLGIFFFIEFMTPGHGWFTFGK